MPQLQYGRVQAGISQVGLVGLAPTMLCFLRANIASTALVFVNQTGVRSSPGCIIASPSYSGTTDQDYVHNWTRDAAIAASELAHWLPAGAPVDQTLCDYVSFAANCQQSAIKANVFFRACFQVDGNIRDWSNQKDGPALQSLAFVDAWPYLDNQSKATATAVAQENVNQTVSNWQDDTYKFGPWEDVYGPSFFARSAQVRFLEEVQSTNTLGLTLPSDFNNALAGLKTALDTHWDPGKGCYLSIPGGKAGDSSFTDVSGYDPNADVVMAGIYGSIPCTDPKLLATAAQLRAAFEYGGVSAYPINQADQADPSRGFGPMIGRYPSDIYDGNVGKDKAERPRDHPWPVCTANFAQLYYMLARSFATGNRVAYDPFTQLFFNQIGLSDPATVNDPAQAATVEQVLRDAGDRMLQSVLFHSDHYRLSEQFDADTGYEKSVSDLTWSYAAYASAARKR